MDKNECDLETLFKNVYPKAYRAEKSICLSRHMAEDAVSEALVRMMNAQKRRLVFGGGECYFMKIVVNESKRLCVLRDPHPEHIRRKQGE